MNKLIVVTGGTKGIGRAILERFSVAGFDVATCARSESDLLKLKANLENRQPIKAYTMSVDMAEKRQVAAFTDYINSLARPVDILVNNAGFFTPGSVLNEKEGSLEAMFQANVLSAYYATRGLVPRMMEARAGHIFNMCSIASIKAYPNGGSYAISKFALLGFSKVLREELKETGIRVTAVMPGATRTSSWDGTSLPENRFMKVEDIAEVIFAAYSLSPQSVLEELIIRPQLGDI